MRLLISEQMFQLYPFTNCSIQVGKQSCLQPIEYSSSMFILVIVA